MSETSPPIRLTKLRTMDKPSPIPPCSRVAMVLSAMIGCDPTYDLFVEPANTLPI